MMLRVLIVDDHAEQVSVMANLLRRSGFEPLECLHSQDCMEMVERLRPDVILLDLTMPSMSGFDIADEIRHNPDLRPSRLIAITGLGSDEYRAQTREHGFDYHFVKPLDSQEILAVLRQIEFNNASSAAQK